MVRYFTAGLGVLCALLAAANYLSGDKSTGLLWLVLAFLLKNDFVNK